MLEELITEAYFDKQLDGMSDDDKSKLYTELTGESTSLSGSALNLALIGLFKAGGFQSYKIAVVVLHFVVTKTLGIVLPFVAFTTLTKTLSVLTGPVGVTVSILWQLMDWASPSYKKVVIPCVLIIGALRLKYSTGSITRLVG